LSSFSTFRSLAQAGASSTICALTFSLLLRQLLVGAEEPGDLSLGSGPTVMLLAMPSSSCARTRSSATAGCTRSSQPKRSGAPVGARGLWGEWSASVSEVRFPPVEVQLDAVDNPDAMRVMWCHAQGRLVRRAPVAGLLREVGEWAAAYARRR
jgi:hypothetical protein